jgi:hypothetical protein
MNELLVRPLTKGVKMFVCFDCCHSGTALDLPYIYNENGKLKCEPEFKNKSSSVEKRSTPAEIIFLRYYIQSLLSKWLQEIKLISHRSGCSDEQTSADATIQGTASGALTYALVKTVSSAPSKQALNFEFVLRNCRDLIKAKKYKQIPQMSTGHKLDFSQVRL